jgi:hypothetical protein
MTECRLPPYRKDTLIPFSEHSIFIISKQCTECHKSQLNSIGHVLSIGCQVDFTKLYILYSVHLFYIHRTQLDGLMCLCNHFLFPIILDFLFNFVLVTFFFSFTKKNEHY